jgi:hypothetical protein
MVRYLSSAGIALLVTATVLIAPAARAANSSIVQQALQKMQSYEMSMDFKLVSTAANASTTDMDAIVVRHD